jgi:undecaprenyl-diphosphatase
VTEPAGKASKKPAAPRASRAPRKPKPTDPEVSDSKATEPASAPVVQAGPVAVHVDSGDVKVVVAPPAKGGFDRQLFGAINGLPHTRYSDRYISVLSDLGEGIGWVAGGVAIAILGGPTGRRAGAATAVASVAATYLVQTRVKPLFRRVRPFVNREATVVGVRPADHSFPSGHTASSFAAATALAFFYPRAAPLAYAVATGVGMSRVHLGVHFPSDAAVGGVIGIGIGTFTAWVFKKRG